MTTTMSFERILETCLQSRRVFDNMNATESQVFLEKVLNEVKNGEPFGRMYFNINMINDWHTRTNLYFQFATSVARYYSSLLRQRGSDDNMTKFMFSAVDKLTWKRLDQQDMCEENGIDR